MKKLGFMLCVVAGALMLAAPAAPAAPDTSTRSPEGRATASAGIVSIPAPRKLQARKKLRIPIRCTVICDVSTTFTLRLPGPNLGPRTLPGTLDPAAPQDLVVSLNNEATRTLKGNIAASKLKVKVRATDPATGAVNFARKVLRFKGA